MTNRTHGAARRPENRSQPKNAKRPKKSAASFQGLPPILLEGGILLLMLAPMVYLAAVWSQLPDTLPMHYNMAGEADRYGQKQELWIPVILVALPIYLILRIVPMTQKEEANGERWQKTYWKLRFFLQACMSGIAAWIVYSVHQPGKMELTLGLGIVLSALFAGLGWIMPADQGPSAFQIRTPWTANNPAREQRTRQQTRRLWMLGGLACIPIVAGLPAPARIPFVLFAIILFSLAPILLSWRYSKANT